jgi:hypothetical protein
MADDKGRPIDTGLQPSPAPHAPTDPEAPKPCIACRRHHGSVGVHLHCLGAEVLRLRAELARRP